MGNFLPERRAAIALLQHSDFAALEILAGDFNFIRNPGERFVFSKRVLGET